VRSFVSAIVILRQRSGAVVCPSCGSLVGVNDEQCLSCGRRNPGLWGFAPLLRQLGNDFGFVPLVVGGSAVLYALSLAMSWPEIGGRGLFSLLSPDARSLFLLGASGSVPVFQFDRWWTVLTAGWLHGGALHILFNMLWVRQLGPAVAHFYGAARLIIIYTSAGCVGFALSSLAGQYLWFMPVAPLRGASITVGASAPIFGLLGALVYYGRRTGSSVVHTQAVGYALMLGLFGFVMPGVDNYAHLGGFAGGWFTAQYLDPLRPERADHMIVALGCLAATAVAVFASVVDGIRLLMP
jgi:rhomboid protease GluP